MKKEKSSIPYSEWMGTQDADIYFDENDEPQLKSEKSVIEVMKIITEVCNGKPGMLKVITCWLNNYHAAHGHSNDGLVTNIARDVGLHRNTVTKYIKTIKKHKVLKKVFKYKIKGEK